MGIVYAIETCLKLELPVLDPIILTGIKTEE